MYQHESHRYIKNKVQKSSNFYNFGQILILVFLCLMTMDLQSRMYQVVIISFFLLIVQKKQIEFHKIVFPALVLSLSLLLFSPGREINIYSILKSIPYPICLLIGYNLIDAKDKKKAEGQVVCIIVFLAVGAYIHFMLNMLSNANGTTDRNMMDYWTKTVLSATGHSSLACLMIGVSITFIFCRYTAYKRILFLGALLSITYYNFMLSGRTVFVMIIILITLNIIYNWLLTTDLNGKLRELFIVFIIISAIVIIFQNNLFGISDMIMKSNFYQRFFGKYNTVGLNEDNRLEYKIQYIQIAHIYPFGGNEIRNIVGNFAHDLILDSYSYAGFFAAGAIVSILVFSLMRLKRLLFLAKIDRKVKILLVNVFTSMLLLFCVEPILEGMPWLLLSFCIICGGVTKLTETSDCVTT